MQVTKSGDLFEYPASDSVDGSAVFKILGIGGIYVATRINHLVNKKVSSVRPVTRVPNAELPSTTASPPVVKVIVKPTRHGDPPNLFVPNVPHPRKKEGIQCNA